MIGLRNCDRVSHHVSSAQIVASIFALRSRRSNIPALLVHVHAADCDIDLSNVIYYVGHETLLPPDALVEIRWQISI